MAEIITADGDFRLYDFKIAGYEQETVNRRRIILQLWVNHAGVYIGSNGLSLQEIR